MDYDYSIKKYNLNYGVILGNNTILFIKVGNGGNIKGYKNKYIKIATEANKKYGVTVIVSETPLDSDEYKNFVSDAKFIDDLSKEQKFDDYKIYAMGYSKGGSILSYYAYQYNKIKRLLIVNAPLMYNWFKIREGLNKFNGERLSCVFGKEDQSYIYTELLKKVNVKLLKLYILENVDHNFNNQLKLFIDLCDDYLLKD